MDKEWKSKWLEALRSGKYKQGRGCLRSENNKFCCLGVLCDLVAPQDWEPGLEEMGHYYGHRGSYGAPDQAIKDVVSIASWGKLMEMNDSGASFTEIADWIEKNL